MSCADPESFVKGDPTLTTLFFFLFFWLMRGERKDPNTTKGRSPSACQRNAIGMAFRWGADDGLAAL